VNRYEDLLRSCDGSASDFASAMAEASAASRKHVAALSEHEAAIRDVAAGVAAPAFVGFVLWVLKQAENLGLQRLCFLSRDAQVFNEIAQRLAPRLGVAPELRYVHCSRRTWNLAAADVSDLSRQDWLFNSLMRSNAADVCARLGLPLADFASRLESVGASLDPQVRADQTEQAAALRRFVALPAVADAVGPAVRRMRTLVRDYAIQEGMTSTRTALVDAGWTGRMIGALTAVTEGLPQPRVFFWAHEPRTTGWTDPARLRAYMYNTATRDGIDLRVPDTPYIIETFCMSDHGIVADYQRDPDGHIEGLAERPTNPAVEAWGFHVFRSAVDEFCDRLEWSLSPTDVAIDLRSVISRLLRAFWMTPTQLEAAAWGSYPYDSDPLARATRSLARPFGAHHLKAVIRGEPLVREDRAWLQGSLALSGPEGVEATKVLSPRYAVMGAPAND
jgi:hypothetical protein